MRTRQSDRAHIGDAYKHDEHDDRVDAHLQPSGNGSATGGPGAQKKDYFAGWEVSEAVSDLERAVADPAALAQPTPALTAVLRAATKALHDFTHQHRSGSVPLESPESQPAALHVDGFDAEQIWGQLDTSGAALLRRARKLMTRSREVEALLLPAAAARLQGGSRRAKRQRTDGKRPERPAAEMIGIESGSDVDAAALKHDSSGESELDEGNDADPRADRQADATHSDQSDSDASEISSLPAETGSGAKRKPSRAGADEDSSGKRPKLSVEDDFLRMDDMEAFVQQAERQATAGSDGESDSEDSDEDEDDDELGGIPNSDVESGSDEDLAALLESTSALVGHKSSTRRAAAAAEDDSDEDGSGGSGGDMYSSFFDPKPTGGRNRRGEDYEEQQSWHGSDSGEDDEVAVDGGEWDGDVLFDTGEGREEATGDDGDEGDGVEGDAPGLSKHEKRTAAMRSRIAAMEAAAIGDKDWFMRGEAQAGHRPLNSALELDLDFERTLQPPPAPTEDSTRSLEDLIRGRIAEGNYDDVIRVAPAATATAKTALELVDKKSTKGLGELYEEEYLKERAPTNIVEERDADAKNEARLLLKGLFTKLDALSHFHYAPKPQVEEMAVVAEVPALAMEEVAPQVTSAADMRCAGEVFSGAKALPAGETELSREDRKRSRAAKKRTSRRRRSQKDAEKKQRSVTADGEALLQGRLSESAAVAAAAAAKKDGKRGGRKSSSTPASAKSNSKNSDYTKSTKVFAKLADEQAARKGGVIASAQTKSMNGPSAASFKL